VMTVESWQLETWAFGDSRHFLSSTIPQFRSGHAVLRNALEHLAITVQR